MTIDARQPSQTPKHGRHGVSVPAIFLTSCLSQLDPFDEAVARAPRVRRRESAAAGGAPRDREVIALVGLAHGTSHFFHLMLPPLFPWLMTDFSLSYTDVGLLTTTFFVISGIGQALAGLRRRSRGWLARPLLRRRRRWRFGRRAGAGRQLRLVDVERDIRRLGNSIFHPADFTILNQRVSQPRLGHAFSIHGVSGNVGWAVAPLFMAGITSVLGWHVAGFGAAAIGAAVFTTLCLRRRALTDAA